MNLYFKPFTLHKGVVLIPVCIFLFHVLPKDAKGQAAIGEVDSVAFHLTPFSWEPLSIENKQLLDVIEATCIVVAKHQNDSGAIVDPYLNREHQYATPYFTFAVGTLLKAGRGEHLKEAGIRAMEHCSKGFAEGHSSIPDKHGEFFIAPLALCLALYQPYVSEMEYKVWEERLNTPLSRIMENSEGRINNWRTYAMKGEWVRAKLGLVDKDTAREFIEWAWKEHTQRIRIMNDKHHLYQDWSSDPQSLAVEAVGRGNLIGLVMEGFDGEASEELLVAISKGTYTSLLLQSPDGQAPANGRTDDHVFNDVLYTLAFEALAMHSLSTGDEYLAGQYRRAAGLAFKSILRWQREEKGWEGSFFITKNHFDPADRVGYQPASQWGNYTGAIIQHLSEALHIRDTHIVEKPTPTEIGGYAFSTDAKFSSFFANAGGMQVVANLRGASVPKYGMSWTPLGVIRFSKQGWDARLGPSDGEHDVNSGKMEQLKTSQGDYLDSFIPQSGVTFGPEWKDQDHWIRIADVPGTYQAIPEIHFVHPLLVRFSLHYTYVTGRGGPYFTQEFVVTPDLVVTRLRAKQPRSFGLTVPLLENDGRPLEVDIEGEWVSTKYPEGDDQQCFVFLNANTEVDTSANSIRSTYGWLRPVKVSTTENSVDVLVYPRKGGDPHAREVRDSFSWTEDGFKTVFGEVMGNVFIGRNAAGGSGKGIDLDKDGEEDIQFSQTCKFFLQLKERRVVAVEVDRDLIVYQGGKSFHLKAFEPFYF